MILLKKQKLENSYPISFFFSMNDFYEENAASYYESTARVDSGTFLHPMLEYLNKGATVLDVGCGSGRDLLWLKNSGFVPTGLEKAKSLAKLANSHSQCPVLVGDFFTFEFEKYGFDAVTLIGSLVHIEASELKTILLRVLMSLKPGGILFISLKEGIGKEILEDGREFQLWQKDELDKIFLELDLSVLKHELKVSNIRKGDQWLGYFLKVS